MTTNDASGDAAPEARGNDQCMSVIGFRVRPGREADFVKAFHACGMLERPRAISGFVSGELLSQLDDEASFIVVATWRNPEAYAEWGRLSREGADEAALAMLGECIAELVPGRLFKRAVRPRLVAHD